MPIPYTELTGETNLVFGDTGANPTRDSGGGFKLTDCQDVKIYNLDIVGQLYLKNCKRVEIFGIDLDREFSGHAFTNNWSEDVYLGHSKIRRAGEDLVRYPGAKGFIIEHSVLGDVRALSGSGKHPDGGQGFNLGYGNPTGLIFRKNLMYDIYSADETYMQGWFLKDAMYSDAEIYDNLMAIGSPNALYFQTTEPLNGQRKVRAYNNTLRTYAAGQGGAGIRCVGQNTGTHIFNNIARQKIDESNGTALYENNYFNPDMEHMFQGTDITDWHSYLPVAGSPIDFEHGFGAIDYLQELLDAEDGGDPGDPGEPGNTVISSTKYGGGTLRNWSNGAVTLTVNVKAGEPIMDPAPFIDNLTGTTTFSYNEDTGKIVVKYTPF